MTTERDRQASARLLREIEERAAESGNLFALQEKYNRLKSDYVELRNRHKQKRDLLNHLVDILGDAIRKGVISRGDYFDPD